MKKILLLNFIFLLICSSLFSQTHDLPAGGGVDGDPYLIASLENLYWITAPGTVNGLTQSQRWNKYYKQTAPIDASETSGWTNGWLPIGNATTQFSGVYDGGNNSVSNLSINRPNTDNIGLFGLTSGAIISNLGVINVSVSGNIRVGALVGANVGNSKISNSFSSGELTGVLAVGGLVGRNEGSTVERSYSETNVTGTGSDSRVGGLVGQNITSSTVSQSYSTGNVNGIRYVGGLVGHTQNSSTIVNSYSRGRVHGSNDVGGLLGRLYDGTVRNSYSTGEVTGTTDVGGLIGSLFGTDNVFNSYWDKESSKKETSVSGKGRTTAEMKLFATYLAGTNAWDFLCETANGSNDIWGKNFLDNDGYPFLAWQGYVNYTGGKVSADQEICFNSVPGDITLSDYLGTIQWQKSANNVVFEDIPGATGATLSAGVIGPMTSDLYFRARVTAGSCMNFSDTVMVQVISPEVPSGDGTSGNPYQIASLQNLLWIGEQSDRWNKFYIQTENIDFLSCANAGAGWLPIGNATTQFTGNYDGKGHTINGLFINRAATDHVGLIGYANGAVISNLGLTNVDITGRDRVGGLVGTNFGNSRITNCFVSGKVTGVSRVGGLVGRNENSRIEESYNHARVTGTGSGTGNNERIGGLVGHNISFADITRSYNAGEVSGKEWVGGLTGHSQNSSNIVDCYNTGNVSGTSHVGGLVGRLFNVPIVTNTYSKGAVSGSTYIGGLIGSSDGTAQITSSFWDAQTSNQGSSSGGTSKTTAQMKDQATFTGWDFNTIWAIDGATNAGYPYFSWINIVWDGSVDSNWHNPQNWNTGVIPLVGDYVIVPVTQNNPVISNYNVVVNYIIVQENAILTVENPVLLTIGNGGILNIDNGGKVIIKPGGSLTVLGEINNQAGVGGLIAGSDASGSGSVILKSNVNIDATVQRYMSGQKWHIISSPVSGLGIQDFISGNNIPENASGEFAMTDYVENKYSNAGGWGNYFTAATGGNMTSGKGYLTALSANNQLVFEGQLVESATIPITRLTNGWNAIGNPFASAIGVTQSASSIQTFLGVNAGQLDPEFAALYLYDPETSTYRIINNAGDDLGQNYLQSGQGFIVKSRVGGGNINFTNNMQYHHHSSLFFKKSVETRWRIIQLKVSDGFKEANTVIRFHGEMTRGLDVTYDAGQYGADPGFRLYTRLVEGDNGVNFAIQALPDYGIEDLVIPVGFDFAEGGVVTFSAGDLIIPPGTDAILEDRELGVFTNLMHDTYTVTFTENSSGPGRFFIYTDIRILDVDDVPKPVADLLEIYSYGKEIHITGEVGNNSHATIFDLMGRQIKSVKLENSNRNSFRVDDIKRGIYLVRVAGEGAEGMKRVFIE
jgi:hypothetical protein